MDVLFATGMGPELGQLLFKLLFNYPLQTLIGVGILSLSIFLIFRIGGSKKGKAAE